MKNTTDKALIFIHYFLPEDCKARLAVYLGKQVWGRSPVEGASHVALEILWSPKDKIGFHADFNSGGLQTWSGDVTRPKLTSQMFFLDSVADQIDRVICVEENKTKFRWSSIFLKSFFRQEWDLPETEMTCTSFVNYILFGENQHCTPAYLYRKIERDIHSLKRGRYV
jgi:hypothetical protein